MKRKFLFFIFILLGMFICPIVYAEEVTADQRWEKIFDVYEKNVDVEEESYTFELTKNSDSNIYDVKFADKADATIFYATQIKRVDNYAIVEFKDNLTEKEGSMIFAALMNMQTLFLMVDDYDGETIGNIMFGIEKIKSGLEESDVEYTYSYKDETSELSITYPSYIKYDLENGVVLEEKNSQGENEVPDDNENQNSSSGEGEKQKEEGTVVKVPDTAAKTSNMASILGFICMLVGGSVLIIYILKTKKQIIE